MPTQELPEIKFLGPHDFEEMDNPSVLYKYRDWKEKNHRRILREREVYFSRPDSFKDPQDCNIPRRFDLLTDEDIRIKYYEDLKKDNPSWDDNRLNQETQIWVDKGLLKDLDRISEIEEKFWGDFNDRFGVLCLTRKPDSKYMWENYSNNHSGICVGFKSLPLFRDRQHFGAGGKVQYYPELPVLIPYKEDSMIESQRQIYSKLDKWEFEDEYRLSKFNIKNRVVKIPVDAYVEVIIGSSINKNHRKDIIRIVSRRLPGVKLKDAYLENDEIRIREIEI